MILFLNIFYLVLYWFHLDLFLNTIVYFFLQTSQSWRECWVVALLCTRYIFTTIRYNKTASAVLHNTMGLISCKSTSLCMDYHYTHLHTRHRSLSHVIKTSWSLKVLVGLLSRNFWSTSWFQFPFFLYILSYTIMWVEALERVHPRDNQFIHLPILTSQ